jgi:cell division protein FtsA
VYDGLSLRTPVPDAEKVKRKCGCALSAIVDDDETIEVASVGGRRPRVMARKILAEILQPRAEEVFNLVWDEIRRAGYEKSLNSGIVLTGGGALLGRRDLVHKLVLWGEHHVSRAEQCVGSCGEDADRNRNSAGGQSKIHFRAFTSTNPVPLHHFNFFWPLHRIKPVKKFCAYFVIF